ncbi:MAG: hypothetical protein AMXMBFR34_23320 [Myxococcaceae bacterium]
MPWLLLSLFAVAVALACAPKLEVRPDEALSPEAMTRQLERARAVNLRCDQAVASLPEELRKRCAVACLSEHLLEVAGLDAQELLKGAQDAGAPGAPQPHRVSVSINDAGVDLWVQQLEDGGFACERDRESRSGGLR